ncbi:MAG: hypothetical protein EOP51_00195 [Sphingobacteriales bacterium]|nr:MAG: hypothetical protein EOP51_00195 [Sphingobacteriales bacterium]
MGAWGVDIQSNDTYMDIRADFYDMLNEGLDVKHTSDRLIKNNQDLIDDPDDANNFWFALAKAQWECKQLDAELLKQVEEIITSGDDILVWRNLGADEDTITKRKDALEKFLAQLKAEQ